MVNVLDSYHDDVEDGCFPSKILAFFVVHQPGESEVQLKTVGDDRPKFALYHCTTREKLDRHVSEDSTLTVKYHLEYDDEADMLLRIESTNIMRGPALVVETKSGLIESVQQVRERAVRMVLDRRDYWGAKFF